MHVESRKVETSEMADFRIPKKYIAILQKKYPDVQITEVINVQVPAKYLEIIQQVLTYLETTASTPLPSTTESRLKFFLESDPLFWPKHNFVPYFSKKLHLFPESPLYVAENKRFQLTREDIEVILTYPFVLNREILYLVLQRLGVLSSKGKPLSKSSVYKWKFIEPHYWSDRFNYLIRTYFPQFTPKEKRQFFPQSSDRGCLPQRNSVLDFVRNRLLTGGYDKQLQHMRGQIEKLHGYISKTDSRMDVLDEP